MRRRGVMVRGSGRGTVRRGVIRWRVVAAAVLLTALVAGCSTGSGQAGPPGPTGGPAAADPTTAAPTTPAAPLAALAITPKNGAEGQSVSRPVTVRATGGRLSVVSVRNGDGQAVEGTMSADRTTWTSTEPLGYDKTYSISA